MKADVWIRFYSNEPTLISNADNVELLNVGGGVLSVVKDDTKYYYNLESIMMYTITNRGATNE